MANYFKKVIPLLNRVMIKRIEAPKTTASGIILPENKEPLYIGKVIEVGSGIREEGDQKNSCVCQTVVLP